MRLLFLNHNVRGRGTWVRAFHLARELVSAGHDVTVVTTSPRARLRVHDGFADGVRVIEAPDLWWGAARTGWDPYNTLRRSLLLRSGRFELVHAFDSRPAVILPALRVAARAGAPLLMDWADWWGRGGRIRERSSWPVRTFFGPVETWFEEAFRLRAAAATVISSALADRLAGLGYDRARTLELPNGCTVARHPDRDTARATLGIEPAARVLIHLGVIMAPDLSLLRQAYERASAVVPELRLVFVGASGRTGQELEGRGITRTGFVAEAEMRAWLAAADAGVAPMHDTVGHRARWPAKVAEYMSAGIPTVVTDVGDIARIVREHRIGWVARPDPAELGDALVRAASGRDGAECGERARVLARGELSWRHVARRLDSFYGEVMGQWRAAA